MINCSEDKVTVPNVVLVVTPPWVKLSRKVTVPTGGRISAGLALLTVAVRDSVTPNWPGTGLTAMAVVVGSWVINSGKATDIGLRRSCHRLGTGPG